MQAEYLSLTWQFFYTLIYVCMRVRARVHARLCIRAGVCVGGIVRTAMDTCVLLHTFSTLISRLAFVTASLTMLTLTTQCLNC